MQGPKETIGTGAAILGCELGSTTIKAVLIDRHGAPLSTGSHQWENQLSDGLWTYDMNDVWSGLAECYASLAANVYREHDASLQRVAAAGVSAMMHGYIAIDESDELLVPFRTWRNNTTSVASSRLTAQFEWPIPQRWTVAHLYQAILDGEGHVPSVARLTTLSGYVHWKLTGEWHIGIGDASGMFPVDPVTGNYDADMLEAFDTLVAEYDLPWLIEDLLPEIVPVGECAGQLTEEGARLLDASGRFEPGVPLCPPEGDAGTGMVVTNSVRPGTGNVSAGTSVFAMLILEEQPSQVYSEIDLVLTPGGELAGMAHANNCTSDLNAWMALFGDVARTLGCDVQDPEVFNRLIPLTLEGDSDAGGLLSYGYVSGEHLTGFSEGRPLFVRRPDVAMNLPNFMRAHFFSALAALRSGIDVLIQKEGARVDELRGHGGLFKSAEVGQLMMAAATNTPVSLPQTAGEGGAWGMALLAAYSARRDREESLADYLDSMIGESLGEALHPRAKDVAGFEEYFERYKNGLPIEAAAVQFLR